MTDTDQSLKDVYGKDSPLTPLGKVAVTLLLPIVVIEDVIRDVCRYLFIRRK